MGDLEQPQPDCKEHRGEDPLQELVRQVPCGHRSQHDTGYRTQQQVREERVVDFAMLFRAADESGKFLGIRSAQGVVEADDAAAATQEVVERCPILDAQIAGITFINDEHVRIRQFPRGREVQRAVDDPKPLYYQEAFLDAKLAEYLKARKLKNADEIVPDEFVRWIFPSLVEHRRPRYEALAAAHGYTIDAVAANRVRTEDEFLALIAAALG